NVRCPVGRIGHFPWSSYSFVSETTILMIWECSPSMPRMPSTEHFLPSLCTRFPARRRSFSKEIGVMCHSFQTICIHASGGRERRQDISWISSSLQNAFHSACRLV